MEAVRGQKHDISTHTLALKVRFILQHQFCLPKIQEMRSVMTFSLHSASISGKGLISSVLYFLLLFKQYTKVRFASFLSGGFTTMAVIKPPERKLLKHTSVQYLTLLDLTLEQLVQGSVE